MRAWLVRIGLVLGSAAVVVNVLQTMLASAVVRSDVGGWLSALLVEHANVVAIVIVAVPAVAVAVRRYRQWRDARKLPPVIPKPPRPDPPPDESLRQPEPAPLVTPPALVGRSADVSRALTVLRRANPVAVVGAHDVGTSVVAAEVAGRYASTPERVAVIDVRGRSAYRPDDVHTTAARILIGFGLDVPADDHEPLLADAANRLIHELRERECEVLLLDNVSNAEQVSWLALRWPDGRGDPALLIAGRPEIATGLALRTEDRGETPDQAVELRRLDLAELRELLARRTEGTPRSRLGRIFRAFRESTVPRPVDDLLRAFEGRPRAVDDLVRVLDQPESSWQRPAEIAEAVLCTRDTGEPMVRLWAGLLGDQSRIGLSAPAWTLLRALAALPVTDLPFDAIRTVSEQLARGREAADELRRRRLLRESTPEHVRLPFEIRAAVHQLERADRDQVGPRAIHAVLRYYGELAGRNGALLAVEAEGVLATSWFQQEEPLLRALLAAEYPADWCTDDVLDELARIAYGLDRWYVRERQSYGPGALGVPLSRLAEYRPELGILAAIQAAATARRIGDLDPERVQLPSDTWIREKVGNLSTLSALDARKHNERALYHLACSELRDTDRVAANEDLENAERELHAAWSNLPIDAVEDRVTVQLNLAAVALLRSRWRERREADAMKALDHLDQAEALAGVDSAEIAGEAHVAELRGVAQWIRGRHILAADLWKSATRGFAQIAEEQAEARCLLRLGLAALLDPVVAGRLETHNVRALSPRDAALAARRRLERSKRLAAGQLDTGSVEQALAVVAERLDISSEEPPPAGTVRWPVRMLAEVRAWWRRRSR